MSSHGSSNLARTRYLQERNRLWFAVQHCDVGTIARALWLSIRRLRHQPRGVHGRALIAGLAGAPRSLWRRQGAARRARHLTDLT